MFVSLYGISGYTLCEIIGAIAFPVKHGPVTKAQFNRSPTLRTILLDSKQEHECYYSSQTWTNEISVTPS